MHSDEPLLRSVQESAKIISVSKSTLWRMIARGDIEVVRVGGLTRIRSAELQRFVEELAPAPR